MITKHIQITYRLSFTSAFHLGTGLHVGLVHRAVARDTEGFLYVPGSTVKGALRDRCEQLARLFDLQTTSPHTAAWAEANPNVDITARVFGTRFHPGRIYFDDLQMVEEDRELFEAGADVEELGAQFRTWQTEKRTQVSLSRLTRTARPGLLYNSEYGIPGLRFEGQIIGSLTGFALAEGGSGTYSLLLLLAGLKSLDRIGGSKSAGAGRIACTITHLLVDGQTVDPDDLLNRVEDIEYYWVERKGAEG